MKTFDDLVFRPHVIGRGAVQARLDLGNDIEVSVVGGDGLYGDGVTSFEVQPNVLPSFRLGWRF